MVVRRLVGALLLALLAALLVPAAPSPAAEVRQAVAVPTVAPVPAGLKGRPFMGLLTVPKGYVQEEYLVSGSATPYGNATILGDAPPDLTGAPALPYVARVTVVRPVSVPSNGSAVVT